MQKTWNAKTGEVARDWYVVDAEGQILGRLATRIADTLRGKGKPQYTPHTDTGDFVVVVNAEKIRVTGKKLDEKLYRRHSGYPGGLKERTLREQLQRRPRDPASRRRGDLVQRQDDRGVLPPPRSPHADHGPAAGCRRRGHVRSTRAGSRGRTERAGGSGAPRDRARARRGRPESPRRAQASRLPHARRAHRRAQEGRAAQGSQGPAVLEALAPLAGVFCRPAEPASEIAS